MYGNSSWPTVSPNAKNAIIFTKACELKNWERFFICSIPAHYSSKHLLMFGVAPDNLRRHCLWRTGRFLAIRTDTLLSKTVENFESLRPLGLGLEVYCRQEFTLSDRLHPFRRCPKTD